MHIVSHTMRGLGRRLAMLAMLPAALLLSPGAGAQSWSALTTPADGHIGGLAGSTLSWGYDIANLDAALWLVTTGVSADTFQYAAPMSMFRFPILGPGQADSMPVNGAFGLYGLTWNARAPLGYVNQGSFLLTAEWWNGDPLAGGSYVAAADSIRLDYSATVTGLPPVPEPSAVLLLVAGLALLGWRHRSSRCTVPASR